jgi:NodT family efflux transporter outer membrane factor (OMF) lipoprotein
MNNLQHHPAGFALALGATLLLSACTLGPDFVHPKALDETHYNAGGDPAKTLAGGGVSQQFEQDMAIANWWELFRSAELNGVLQDGFAHNPGVDAAKASLHAAEDNIQAGYGIYYPQVSAALSPTRQRYSPARIGSPAPGSIFNLVTLSASVNYTLDIFGGEHRLVESLEAQRDVQRAEVSGTYLALSGNIVNTAIALAAYRDEIALTEEILALLKEQIALTEKQAEAGTTAYSAVLALENQLAQEEALLPPLKQKLDQADHLLATLTGHTPAEWKAPDIRLSGLTLPAKLPLSLPSELVKSRPDILAAESAMHAASANIGVAAAAQFPSFTLSGSYGQNASSMNNLFGSGANFWSIGADLATPVFDGGTLSAKK